MINIFAYFFKHEKEMKKTRLFPCGALNAELCRGPVTTGQQAAVAPTLRSVSQTLSLSLSDAFSLDLPFKAKLVPYLCANLLLGPTRVARMLNLSFLGFSRLSRCSLWSPSP